MPHMKFLLMIVASIFLAHGLWAQDELSRNFSLNTGYAERFFNSNEALVEAPLSAIEAYTKLFDVTTAGFRDHWGKRLVNILVDIPVNSWLANALSLPFHEFGHARAFHALGLPYTYGTVAYGLHISKLTSFWSLSALRLLSPPWPLPGYGYAYTATTGTVVHMNEGLYHAKGASDGLTIIVTGAGINNQMLLAKSIATTFYEHNGHPLYLTHYVTNKILAFSTLHSATQAAVTQHV